MKIGHDAVAAKGWWRAHQWLVLRRLCQSAILALFLAGPLAGIWIVKGNLNFSKTLNILPLTDPYALLQSIFAGHRPGQDALVGVALTAAFYLVVGGRAYCAWVCPLNLVTDLAAWLRSALGIKGGAHVSRQTRFWLFGATLLLALATGSLAWELVNPVSMLARSLLFAVGLSWSVILAVFLFDLFVMNRGWCGHLCPTGAFFSLLGHRSVVRVSAAGRAACNDCNECFVVCPEPLVLKAPLQDGCRGIGPVILSAQCTNCGRCIDVCSRDVFAFGGRKNPGLLNPVGASHCAPK